MNNYQFIWVSCDDVLRFGGGAAVPSGAVG